MRVLVTAPSLEVKDNVSGISAVVNTIINNNKSVEYIHLLSGKKDNENKGSNRISQMISVYIGLIKILKNNGFDILHLNLPLNSKSIYRDFITYKICKIYNKKVLVHLHGGTYLFKKATNILTNKVIKSILISADILVALSDLEKETVMKLYGVKSMHVLKNTIDSSYQDIPRKLKKPGDVYFLFLGRLNESKGLKNIIASFNSLNLKDTIKLKIYGKGPLEDYVKSAVAENNNIEFLGLADGESKKDILSEADIFLLPSLHGEGLPIALLEAMAAGLAPIVTEDGSMKDIIENEVNGLIVQKDNNVDLANKMRILLSDNELYSKIALNAKMYIKNNFSIVSYIEKLNNFYNILQP